jgi:hypothetical protein
MKVGQAQRINNEASRNVIRVVAKQIVDNSSDAAEAADCKNYRSSERFQVQAQSTNTNGTDSHIAALSLTRVEYGIVSGVAS